jgi:hypothetical protein
MTHQISFSNSKLDKAMNQEQFNQVVEAILAGKYSWACVLILRFAGYNPLHYIPYRTYNRLVKENCLVGNSSTSKPDSTKTQNQKDQTLSKTAASRSCLSQIKDLAYLEVMGKQQANVSGGLGTDLSDSMPEDISHEDKWLQITHQLFTGIW